MKASIEISLYPLVEEYKERITDFIMRMRAYDDIEVHTNGMSTQIFGNYDRLMEIIELEIKDELQHERCVAVIKISGGHMKPDSLPEKLR